MYFSDLKCHKSSDDIKSVRYFFKDYIKSNILQNNPMDIQYITISYST